MIKFMFWESCWLSYPLLLILDLWALYSSFKTTLNLCGCRLRKRGSKYSYFYVFTLIWNWNKLMICVTTIIEFVVKGQYFHNFNPAVFFIISLSKIRKLVEGYTVLCAYIYIPKVEINLQYIRKFRLIRTFYAYR